MKQYFKPGAWNVICDVCGFEHKSTDVRQRWDGLIVCKDDFERDHPQKYIRVRAENSQTVPFVRTEPEENFRSLCYVYASTGYAGIAEAGCMRAGDTTITYATAVETKGS